MKGPLHRLGAVVELVDGFLDQPAHAQAPHFQWDGVPCVPIAKPQSRYVFLQVTPGAHVLQVSAPPFEPCTMNVELPQGGGVNERLIRCVLEPGARYAYPAHVTLLCGRVRDLGDTATVSAEYCSALGRPHRAQTFGAKDRDYTLVLKGRLADPTDVTLRVDLPDGRSGQQTISVKPGRTLRVDIQPSSRT
jgi:hypothetical protein